jgi:hypothetical protein
MDIKSSTLKDWLFFGSLGVMVSLCIVAIVGGGLFYNEVYYTVLPTGTTVPSNTPIPTETATPTLTSTPPPAGPTLDASLIIGQAYEMMEAGDIQGAIDLLEENLDGITDEFQRALAIQTIADLYSTLGNYQFAVVYYEKLYELQPIAYVLYLIASNYDAAGNLVKAQEYYLKCLELYDPGFSESDREIVKQRSEELKNVLTGATLTPVPTATPE